jgi:hypothetical protein
MHSRHAKLLRGVYLLAENDSAVILINRSVCIAGKRAPTKDRRHTGAGVNSKLAASPRGWRESQAVGVTPGLA